MGPEQGLRSPGPVDLKELKCAYSVITVAAVMLASTVQIDRVSMPCRCRRRTASPTSWPAARKALGGEDKIAALKGLTAEGRSADRWAGATWKARSTLTIVRPDKMRRVEEMAMGGMVGGPMIERTSVLAGNTAWDDTRQPRRHGRRACRS